MTVRSRWFITANFNLATPTVVYTAPVDRTLVIRHLAVVNNTADAHTYTVFFNGVGVQHAFYLRRAIAAFTDHHFTEWFVLNPSKTLAVSRDDATAGTLRVHGFGSLLSGVPS